MVSLSWLVLVVVICLFGVIFRFICIRLLVDCLSYFCMFSSRVLMLIVFVMRLLLCEKVSRCEVSCLLCFVVVRVLFSMVCWLGCVMRWCIRWM